MHFIGFLKNHPILSYTPIHIIKRCMRCPIYPFNFRLNVEEPSNSKFTTTTGQTVELGKPAREVSLDLRQICYANEVRASHTGPKRQKIFKNLIRYFWTILEFLTNLQVFHDDIYIWSFRRFLGFLAHYVPRRAHAYSR